MRYALPLLCFALPSLAMAEDVFLPSEVTGVTVFPSAATVRREVSFSLPEGSHRLILTDMPFIDPASLRLQSSDGQLGAVAYRDDFVPPRDTAEGAEVTGLRARIEALEAQIAEVEQRARAIDLEAETFAAQVGFLSGLGSTEGLATAPQDQLRALLGLIGDEGLALRRQAEEARRRAADVRREKTPLTEDLAEAQDRLAALQNEAEDRAYLTVSLDQAAAAEGVLTLVYTTRAASWRPAYDYFLTTGEAPALEVQRSAFLRQDTGENWDDVTLQLSTAQPSGQAEPGEVYPWPLRYGPAPRPLPSAEALRSVTSLNKAGGMADAAPRLRPVADNGVTLTYEYDRPVSVASGAEAVKIDLDRLDFAPDLYAMAVPLMDQTAYLMAGFTNSGGEPLLPAEQAQFFVDGTFMGARPVPMLPAGEEADWSFGPIEGLRLERRVENRMEGEEGVLRRSNTRREAVTLHLRNLTDRSWPVRLRDHVPYSEQEDLRIAWSAEPAPAAEDVEGQRGVLEWRFDLAAGAEQDVALEHEVTWPEGQVLR